MSSLKWWLLKRPLEYALLEYKWNDVDPSDPILRLARAVKNTRVALLKLSKFKPLPQDLNFLLHPLLVHALLFRAVQRIGNEVYLSGHHEDWKIDVLPR